MSTASTPVAKAARVVPIPTIRFTGDSASTPAVRVDGDDATLGRSQADGYVVANPRVSRVHARLTRRAGTVILTDLGSSGGTAVNDADIDGPCRLAHGDVIAFNGVECYFEDPAASVADEQPTTVLQISPVDTGPGLSPCQQQVLERIADGATNREIGELLGISERTVKAYASELYGKLDVSNRAGAVAQGVKHGLL